ncbi:hypothetical protein F5Y07DRAFT_382953 [Xylaria sp. FL0933]|nr:hypothetical protein F5Y07DRAFT_382953 [Xylaria sp. FL0933]
MDRHQQDIVGAHPLGTHLDSTLQKAIIQNPAEADTLNNEDLQGFLLALLSVFLNYPAAHLLSSQTKRGTLRQDLAKLIAAVSSNTANYNQIKPFLNAVFTRQSDVEIWERVYHAVAISTPPQKPVSSFEQTPSVFKTSSIVNSSEIRLHIDKTLKDELGVMYVDIPKFYEVFFGNIPNLENASTKIFQQFTDETPPRFQGGCWTGWPRNANQDDVLDWLVDICGQLTERAQDYGPRPTRRPLAQPNKPLDGSIAKRKPDFSLIDGPTADHHWSNVLIPAELKRNPKDDTESKARLDLGRYVKEIFTTQPTRRFVLGFTLCGHWMRLWQFNRLGGVASTKFDIHQQGKLFVSAILGFLWMDDESLGFDSTIKNSNNQQYVDIKRDGITERLVIDSVMRRPSGISGRATTCWKAYSETNKMKPLVIKDSWQFSEREDEGKLLKEATEKGVANVARYYSHATVCIGNNDDDIQENVRKGLDVTKASNYPVTKATDYGQERLAQSSQSHTSSAGSKRLASQVDAFIPPSKRPCSNSVSTTKSESQPLPNRIHRRIILCDYGKPIYKASSPVALLKALVGCIEGHESLYKKAGILHRDVSINNLIINEDDENPSQFSFLIDLDLAIRVDRRKPSGAKEKTGTRAFMSIGVLLGNTHSFMHDLESFYWVLLWICIHYDKEGKHRVVPSFDDWNYANTEQLVRWKQGTISKMVFNNDVSKHFTKHYSALAPWVAKLRDVVFPNGEAWEVEDESLYSQMKDVLRAAQIDLSQ